MYVSSGLKLINFSAYLPVIGVEYNDNYYVNYE